MSNPNWHISFGRSLAVPFIVHQIFFISPIVRKNQRLIASTYLSIYSYIWLTIHLTLMVVFMSNTLGNSASAIKEIGYIWYTLSILDLLMSKVAFIIIVVLSQRNKLLQLKFLTNVANLDTLLSNEFQVNKNYTNMAIYSLVSIGVCFLYAIIASFMICGKS